MLQHSLHPLICHLKETTFEGLLSHVLLMP